MAPRSPERPGPAELAGLETAPSPGSGQAGHDRLEAIEATTATRRLARLAATPAQRAQLAEGDDAET